ncbi:hypothetical protein AAY473_023387 [Plecturocebus cupreus]
MESHHVAQTGLELLSSSDPPTSTSQNGSTLPRTPASCIHPNSCGFRLFLWLPHPFYQNCSLRNLYFCNPDSLSSRGARASPPGSLKMPAAAGPVSLGSF